MNSHQVELYDRVKSFHFDAPGTTYTFVQRLAKENGWSRDFAVRVVEEYRRFAFLGAAAGHPVSPSDAVDQAWHLHLVYTRSYWDEFCGKVLRMPLHHEPSAGGHTERAKFDNWYAGTLASYRRWFAQNPPADIWPSPETKATHVEEFRRVDVARHWIIRKPRLGIGIAAATFTLSLALIVMGCTTSSTATAASSVALPFAAVQSLNPFDLRGPDFLLLYAIAFVAAFGLAWTIRSGARGTSEPPRNGIHLDPYQIAYLNGGPVHAVNAAISSLFHRDILQVNESDATINVLQPQAQLPHPLEQAVHDAAYVNGTGRVAVRDVRARAQGAVERLAEGLKKAGLLVGDDAARSAAVRATLTALTVPAIGLVKVAVGISREKPVAFLVLACVVSAVLALAVFTRRPHRTRRGDAALRGLRASNARLRTNVAQVGPEALVLGIALFGLNFLGDTSLEFLNKTLRPKNSSSFSSSGCGGSGCGGATSCGASSCGGGGCGGGGCGGGGCGGCGGGD